MEITLTEKELDKIESAYKDYLTKVLGDTIDKLRIHPAEIQDIVKKHGYIPRIKDILFKY